VDDLPGQLPAPGEWAEHGACVDHDNPDLWFPTNSHQAREAIEICHTCPVERDCLEHAIRVGEIHGIWGGKSERERARIRRTARRGAA
jgi:WhiB family redox-sensing transcriptional regulator